MSCLSATNKVYGQCSSFMMFFPHLPVVFLLQVAFCLASTATNYSIDDQDPLFTYSPSWTRITDNLNSSGGNMDIDGGHMLTRTPGTATITYTCAYLLKVNSTIKNSQPISFPSFFSLSLSLDSEVDKLNETYIFSRFGLLSSSSMALHSSHQLYDRWKHICVGRYAGSFSTGDSNSRRCNHIFRGSCIVDWYCQSRAYDSCNHPQWHPRRWQFWCCWYVHVSCPLSFKKWKTDWIWLSFEVLDSPTLQTNTKITGTTSQTNTGTTGTTSQTSTTCSTETTAGGTASSSSGTLAQGLSSNVVRNLAISMGVVGASLAVLFVFLLWRFCIRRNLKDRNGGNMNLITPQSRYHSIPTILGYGTHVPLDDNSMLMMSDGATSHYDLDIQKYGSIIVVILPPAQIPSLIVTILLSPSAMTDAVPRRIVVYRPHSMRIN